MQQVIDRFLFDFQICQLLYQNDDQEYFWIKMEKLDSRNVGHFKVLQDFELSDFIKNITYETDNELEVTTLVIREEKIRRISKPLIPVFYSYSINVKINSIIEKEYFKQLAKNGRNKFKFS